MDSKEDITRTHVSSRPGLRPTISTSVSPSLGDASRTVAFTTTFGLTTHHQAHGTVPRQILDRRGLPQLLRPVACVPPEQVVRHQGDYIPRMARNRSSSTSLLPVPVIYHKRYPAQAPPSLSFQRTVIRSGGAMNRRTTLSGDLFHKFLGPAPIHHPSLSEKR